MPSIKWDEVTQKSIFVFSEFKNRGVVPTLRTIHYSLVSREIIPNTKSAYKGLSTALVKARQDGVIGWDSLADEGRTTEEGENGYIWDPEEYANLTIRSLVNRVTEAVNGASSFSYPMWMNQNYYVEMWIEKSALRATFKQYIKNFNVTLVPSRGYSSWTFLKDAAERIREKAGDKEIIILYYGDFDPSGVDIERFLRESMNGYFDLDVKVNRIGVTKEQIEKYNLPTTPEDAEEIEKLQRDSRFSKWEYGNYRVELDALLAFVPDEFENLVTESVIEYFDYKIYEEVLKKERGAKKLISSMLKAQLPEKIKEVIDGTKEDE